MSRSAAATAGAVPDAGTGDADPERRPQRFHRRSAHDRARERSGHGSQLTLTLNTPPSFHDPKSVLVAALPAVEEALPPPLHAVSPKDIYCARRNSLVLPVEGAPLVFSTEYAHDTFLRVKAKSGE